MDTYRLKTGKTVIVGAGRAGGSLALAMHAAGYALDMIIDTNSDAARTVAAACGCRYAEHMEAIDADTALLFLAVPDDGIGAAARAAAAAGVSDAKTIAVHLSGLQPAAVLDPLPGPKASFHPCSTFAFRQQAGFAGIMVALEGDPAAVEPLGRLAEDLGAQPVIISTGQKALYHAACTTASNLVTAVIHQAVMLLRASGEALDPAMLMPLIRRTVENIDERGTAASLTGPVMRGDQVTIRAHLEAIQAKVPELLPLYRTLSLAAAEMAIENGADRDRIAGVIDVLRI